MKLLIMNSLDERYGSTYRIRAIANEFKKLEYDVVYFEKRKSFFLKWLEMKWVAWFSKYDVLLIQKFNPLTFAPIWIARMRGKFVIVDWDDWDTGLQSNPILKLMTWICECTLPSLANLITSHNEELLSLIPKNKESMLLLQGYDDQLFTQQPRTTSSNIRVGYLCTFTTGGTLDLDDILIELAKVKNPDVTFTIIGGGPLLSHFQHRAKELGISQLKFLGHVPHENIPATLNQLDLGLIYMKDTKANRSRSSFKVLEYLASGIYVVGQCVGVTDRHFHSAIHSVPLVDLSTYLNGLKPQSMPKNAPNSDLLKGFTWSKIVFRLHERLKRL